MSIEFVYFDLGGVLLSFCHDRMCRQMAEAAGVPVDIVRTALLGGEPGASLQWRLERGDIAPHEAFEHFCRATRTNPQKESLYAAASDIFAPLEETIAVVRRLHAEGVPLGILSNTNPYDWGFVTSGRFPFLNELFPIAALSYEARAMKPEPAIYRYAAKLAATEPERIFFTDDREDNVAGARAAGFDAVVFHSAADLASELAARGLID